MCPTSGGFPDVGAGNCDSPPRSRTPRDLGHPASLERAAAGSCRVPNNRCLCGCWSAIQPAAHVASLRDSAILGLTTHRAGRQGDLHGGLNSQSPSPRVVRKTSARRKRGSGLSRYHSGHFAGELPLLAIRRFINNYLGRRKLSIQSPKVSRLRHQILRIHRAVSSSHRHSSACLLMHSRASTPVPSLPLTAPHHCESQRRQRGQLHILLAVR